MNQVWFRQSQEVQKYVMGRLKNGTVSEEKRLATTHLIKEKERNNFLPELKVHPTQQL